MVMVFVHPEGHTTRYNTTLAHQSPLSLHTFHICFFIPSFLLCSASYIDLFFFPFPRPCSFLIPHSISPCHFFSLWFFPLPSSSPHSSLSFSPLPSTHTLLPYLTHLFPPSTFLLIPPYLISFFPPFSTVPIFPTLTVPPPFLSLLSSRLPSPHVSSSVLTDFL